MTKAEESWPLEASERQVSPYRREFRQGAILIPRRLVLVEHMTVGGMLPPNPAAPLVRGRTSNLDKHPWNTVESPQGPVERDFLRPALLGASIAPFRALEPFLAVIPWDEDKGRLLDAEMASGQGYSRLSQWLEKTETLWNENGRGRRSLLEQYDFFSQLSKQFPVAPIRVVYTKAGRNPVATVIIDEIAVVDHKLYWAAVESLEEARYLCSILNSETLRAAVEPYQAQGQWGARDIDKYVFNVLIPSYDGDNALHHQLASAGARAETVAGRVTELEGEHFMRARNRIRAALADDGIAEQLENLVAELFQGE